MIRRRGEDRVTLNEVKRKMSRVKGKVCDLKESNTLGCLGHRSD